MPWLETDVRDQRIQFVLQVLQPGATVAATSRAFGITAKTGHKWLRRYRQAGSVAALTDHSRRSHHSPRQTSAALRARVLALREDYGWAGEKLAALLAAEGLRVAPRTIDRIVAAAGLTHADTAPTAAVTRFARATPNELWQLDAKGHYPLPRGRCYPLSVLDDHSPFAVGLYALPTLQAADVRGALVACFEQYGVPHALLCDHGTPWWAPSNAAGLSTLSVFRLQQGIRLLHGRIRHPQTQGKVERFHRTLGERLRWWGVPGDLSGFQQAFGAFRTEYNDVRPHEALGQQPPARHFHPSPRPYRAHPPAWVYPRRQRRPPHRWPWHADPRRDPVVCQRSAPRRSRRLSPAAHRHPRPLPAHVDPRAAASDRGERGIAAPLRRNQRRAILTDVLAPKTNRCLGAAH